MIAFTDFMAVLFLVVGVSTLIICVLAYSRNDWRDKARWRDADNKDVRSEVREAEKTIDMLRKRNDMVCDERAFWRTKAIHLGYPAAGDEQ